MSDNKFSLDDILNEYSGSGSSNSSSSAELDDILNSYPASKTFEASGLAEIFDSRSSEADIDLSDINVSLQKDYPTPEEIRRREGRSDAVVSVHDIPEELLTEEEKIKKSKQIDYEILSGDYERKYMPDELKTEAELAAERRQAKKDKKKSKVKPAKKKFGLDFADGIKGVHSIYDEDDDDFERKYGDIPLFTEGGMSSEHREEHEIPFEIAPRAGRSLSEKLEHEDEYNEKYSDIVKERTREAERVKPVRISARVSEEKKNPLEKYAEIDDLDSIINAYETGNKPKAVPKSDTSPLRGFTDIFNKLMAKEEEDSGHSELLEESRRPKRAVPIERKKISDIDLDLSDKVIQDTAQINADKTRQELEKLSELKERRDKKIKDFVLLGDEEENTPEEIAEDNDEPIDEYENPSDAQIIDDSIRSQYNKLMLRLVLLLVFFAASMFIAVANDFDLPIIDSINLINKRVKPDIFLFINSILGIGAGFVASQTIATGLTKLIYLKADCDTLASVALVSGLLTSMITLADANMVKGSFVYIYTPVAIGALIFNTVGKLLIVSRTRRSFRYVSGDNDHYAIFIESNEERAQNFTRGALADFPVLAGMQKTEIISDFLKTSYATDSTDRFCRMVTPVIGIAGVLLAIISALLAYTEHGTMGALCTALSTFSACASMCSCFAMTLVVSLPMEKASKKYGERQGAILGFDSIDEFCDTNSIMIDAAQLFPPGSICLRNIKTFPDTTIDEAIVEAASLTSQSGSILKNMFYDIIVGKTEMLNPVESYIYEDSMGLCGWINNKRVLLGNRELMQNHSIEGLPSVAKEKEYTDGNRIAVYLSISGQLSAMFIIELIPSYQVKAAVRELEKNGISIMLRSVDSMLSVNRLSEMFEVIPSMFKLIPFRFHTDYEKSTEYTAKRHATLACSGRFSTFAKLIVGTNRLRGTISVGIAMQAAAILLGILMTLALVLLRSMTELTVTNVVLYNMAFVFIYYIFVSFRKQ